MTPTFKILRFLGCLAGVWLLVSSISGIRQIFSLYSNSPSISPLDYSLHLFGPSIVLGLLLPLPWSRIRSSALWGGAFVVLLAAGGAYLWRLFLPFTVVWRPTVLFDAGILQRLLLSVAFVVLQVIVILLLRFRTEFP